MFVTALSLHHFKNYSTATLSSTKKVNCLVGENGAGKTNLLDALFYLCISKSYFQHQELRNIEFEKDFFRIVGKIEDKHEENKIEISYAPKRGKQILLDGVAYEKLSDHVGKFPVIMIAPDDNQLILGGSDERRRFIDTLLCQLDRAYLKNLQVYNRQLTQRNALLKQFAERNYFNREALKAYEVLMASASDYICAERKNLISTLRPVFEKLYQEILGDKEKVSLIYESEVEGKDLLEIFEENLLIDRKIKRSSTGAHRDDIAFEMNAHRVKRFGSQGQQKSFLIALKLAQVELLEKITGKKPLLLLDDIFDKLDEQRGANLLQFILDPEFGQVFMTDTSLERIQTIFKADRKDVALFEIKNGEIYEK